MTDIDFDPADAAPPPPADIDFDPRDAGAAPPEGDSPETAYNRFPPDKDFGRFLLNLGTTGPDQVVRELARGPGKYEAVNLDGEIKVRSKEDQKWYSYDPSGFSPFSVEGWKEIGRDVADFAPDAITGIGAAGGAAGAFLGTGGPVNPLVSGPAAVAGGAAGGFTADVLRTQGLGRLLGFDPGGKETTASAFEQGAYGGLSTLLTPAVRPLARLGARALRLPAAMDRGVINLLTRAGRTRPGVPHTGQLGRLMGPSATAAFFMSGMGIPGAWNAAKVQGALQLSDFAGWLVQSLASPRLLVRLRRVAAGAPAAFRPALQALIAAGRGGTGRNAVANAALRIPGLSDYLRETMQDLMGVTIRNKQTGEVGEVQAGKVKKYLADPEKWEVVRGGSRQH